MENSPEHTPLITVEHFENEDVERLFIEEINTAYEELRTLLPQLPKQIRIIFGTSYDYGEDGATGSSISSDLIRIGINPDVEDRSRQHAKMRQLVFHEGYHVAQGFDMDSRFSALDSAVYEGCATVFEREYAHSTPKWGNYQKEDATTLQRWYNEMSGITADQYFEESGETWQKWAFYDPETDESWRVYKVGTWIVDQVLAQSKYTILDLCSMSAEEIRSLVS